MVVDEARWRTIEIAEQTVEVFEPNDAVAQRAILVLPGGGRFASGDAVLTRCLGEMRMRAVSPRMMSWWLDRIEQRFSQEQSPLDFLQESVLPWLATHWDAQPPHVRLLGWDEGGQGILQLAFRRPLEFPDVAAIDAAIDFHELYGYDTVITELFPNREAARQRTAILRLHPAGWPRRLLLVSDRRGEWFDGADRLEMKLRSGGIPLETEFYSGEVGKVDDRASAISRAMKHLGREVMGLPVVGR